MKNKIISGVIAVLFWPASFFLYWVVARFLSARVVLAIAVMIWVIILVYKLSKLILDHKT